jgi:hypothetical protein
MDTYIKYLKEPLTPNLDKPEPKKKNT